MRWRDPGYVIDARGCWLYRGYVDKNGYPGTLKGPDGYDRAHRVYYKRTGKRIPKGKQLGHKCHVRRCVNPAHLEPATRIVNCRRGAGTKLTPAQVQYIRANAHQRPRGGNGDGSQTAVAAQLGVTQGLVSMILSGDRWES